MVDSYRHKGLRAQLVAELVKSGIKDEFVLRAIQAVPRHLFLDKAFEEWAYKDTAFPIDCEQTISQPYTVAFQTSLLHLKAREKVLEIGLGSGYQACVLSEMGAKVYSIERHKHLHNQTAERLKSIGYTSIRTFYGDGFKGLPRFAPFDKILITAAAPEVPAELIKQLKVGGILVIPLNVGSLQKMIRITKLEDETLKKEQFGDFRFVPMLKGTE
ncbi:MAG: protein-L-isoaspartate(D-aspartate) O-methyltransferase [Saprospiraceae bacterium]|nr:protein-L-isoaspartate(D-aspartate) O-methyltransferase [Saprospiraceae bacterium]MBK8451305.1 protein-L-isoaspartate(D-aspartate) O-methyltransferase [Saprospiraceae bacterium]MBK9220773.1 protein-L-isoaspartate(D-aspartate) O-methyltransferase [Saprospiraceae bacterium]MBK9722382.1 protein-L-isoaspartate(D-aspartate) O-methyltransferase [Saprospiraceae bacterium]MBK9729406.1 protein-L-isoaspartate(D-aspartate) O-methyltransferase [Saprospiraceae bacterium]